MDSQKAAAVNTDAASSAGNSMNNKVPVSAGQGEFTPATRSRRAQTSLDLDDYFTGPRDMHRHSKWPYFLRIHGSVLPKMIVPLSFIAGWATAITCISQFIVKLGINSVLLTVLGFVVGLSLSFRSSTAYERYNDGRKYWAQLMLASRNMSRLIWIHAQERHKENAELGKKDLLAKLTALNLVNAFAVALKHRLRFEPSTEYSDLQPLIGNLSTFAGAADQTFLKPAKPSNMKAAGEYLGLSFAQSNPRKLYKKSKDPLGNLPLEVLNYLAAYVEAVFTNGTLKTSIHQTQAMNNLAAMTDVLTGTERVLNTPLPIAYSIAISQITLLYVMVLPFQLWNALGWITIPGTVVAAYIILGIAAIGNEIENPFGMDVNNLPLDAFCAEIAADIDMLTSSPAPLPSDFIENAVENKVLFPLSVGGYDMWKDRSVEDIRAALKTRASANPMVEQTQLPIPKGDV